jgi:hypothetical protein
VLARSLEELDTITNRGNEDRLIITVETNSTPTPVVFDGKKSCFTIWFGDVLSKMSQG